jgi:hypothetical protein
VKWTIGSIDAAGFPAVKINRIAFDGTQFIAVGNQKRIYTSTDALPGPDATPTPRCRKRSREATSTASPAVRVNV